MTKLKRLYWEKSKIQIVTKLKKRKRDNSKNLIVTKNQSVIKLKNSNGN